jgi:hypothetical protein
MQESEFTGCANKVQGKPQNRAKFSAEGTELSPARGRRNARPRPEARAHKRAHSADRNAILFSCVECCSNSKSERYPRVDASCRFLYDDGVGALSSAVRAFGLHPKGRPFKSDSAHHCDASLFSGDVVQLVRTLPCHGRGREFESRRPRHIFQSLTSPDPNGSGDIRGR